MPDDKQLQSQDGADNPNPNQSKALLFLPRSVSFEERAARNPDATSADRTALDHEGKS